MLVSQDLLLRPIVKDVTVLKTVEAKGSSKSHYTALIGECAVQLTRKTFCLVSLQ
jgi:hypothetical protein